MFVLLPCVLLTIQTLFSIRRFDSMIRFEDSIRKFDSIVRSVHSIRWFHFENSIRRFDSILRYEDSMCWFHSKTLFDSSFHLLLLLMHRLGGGGYCIHCRPILWSRFHTIFFPFRRLSSIQDYCGGTISISTIHRCLYHLCLSTPYHIIIRRIYCYCDLYDFNSLPTSYCIGRNINFLHWFNNNDINISTSRLMFDLILVSSIIYSWLLRQSIIHQVQLLASSLTLLIQLQQSCSFVSIEKMIHLN